MAALFSFAQTRMLLRWPSCCDSPTDVTRAIELRKLVFYDSPRKYSMQNCVSKIIKALPGLDGFNEVKTVMGEEPAAIRSLSFAHVGKLSHIPTSTTTSQWSRVLWAANSS